MKSVFGVILVDLIVVVAIFAPLSWRKFMNRGFSRRFLQWDVAGDTLVFAWGLFTTLNWFSPGFDSKSWVFITYTLLLIAFHPLMFTVKKRWIVRQDAEKPEGSLKN
ncbi:hypothetical protein K8I28_10170 [bacterium]|nr:hypothetical protein [bacterium]